MDFLQYAFSSHQLLELSHQSVEVVSLVNQTMLEKLERDETEPGQHDQSSLAHLSRLAESEIQRDFPLLHSHSLVGLWGALEACMSDIFIGWIEHLDSSEWTPPMRKLKVQLSEWLALPEADRSPWLLDQIRRDRSSDLKSGIQQFESVLSAIGLDGSVDPAIREVMFQVKSLRNVIAHKGGRVDARFVEDCPSFKLSVGDDLRLSNTQIEAANTTMVLYVKSVLDRIRSRAGEGPYESEPSYPGNITSTEDLRTLILPSEISKGELGVSPGLSSDE